MRIWCQTYATSGADSREGYFEEALRRYIPKIARPDTEVDVHGVEKRAPKMLQSSYLRYLHIAQVIEKALQAEREGYDALLLAGMRDLGYFELIEVSNIPVVFTFEASYHFACLLAPKFTVICINEESLRAATAVIKGHGLEERYVPGAHIGVPTNAELMESFEKNPLGIIDAVSNAAKKVIGQDADILVPGFAGLSVFLAEQGVRELDGVPVLDTVAAAIKTAETTVDLAKLGISRRKKLSKEEIVAARKLYGFE